MDRHQLGNTYGNVTADGNTNIQLGDRSINNYITVETAYITLQDELELPHPQLLQNSQHTNIAADGLYGALTVGRASRHPHVCKRRRDDEGISEDQPAHKAPCRGLSSARRSIKSIPRPLSAGRDSSSSMANASSQDRLALEQGQSHAVYELLLTLATILSCILGRNVSPSDLSDFIRKCQHDQLLPAMTFLLGIGLYRYFSSRRLLQNPSCMGQERITLEDAYGRLRLLSLDICGDFDVFKTFLESHYRETTAPTGEALVKAGQFNLILGSRRGNVLHPSKWRTNRLTPGSRIINSVYMKSNDGKCFACQKSLIVSELGEFHCLSCQTFYRDHDTLREVQTTLSDPMPSIGQDDFTSTDMLITRQSPARQSPSCDTSQYKVAGLRNLDIQIVPRITLEEPGVDAQAVHDQNTSPVVPEAFVQNLEELEEGAPVEYGAAIAYVNKVKNRFAQQPEIYKIFLEILQDYQREARPIQEVYSQIVQLFASAPDLINDFHMFLPNLAARSNAQVSQDIPTATTTPQLAGTNMQEQMPNETLTELNARSQRRRLAVLQRNQKMANQQAALQQMRSNYRQQTMNQTGQAQYQAATNINHPVNRSPNNGVTTYEEAMHDNDHVLMQNVSRVGRKRVNRKPRNTTKRPERLIRNRNRGEPSDHQEGTPSGSLLPGTERDANRPPPPALTQEDNTWINYRAADMAKGTTGDEMMEIVERMEPRVRQSLREKQIDPIIYHFRMEATKEFRRRQG